MEGLTQARRADLLALALVLLGAGALRFIQLDRPELFRDEAASWLLSSAAWSEILPRSASETYAPLYAYLLKAWMSIFGDGEAALRSLSAFAGVAMVAVTWLWGRQAFGRGIALVAAALVAVSPLAIGNAREARMYALDALFVTLSWWLLWCLLAGSNAPRWRIATITAGAAAVALELWTLPVGIGAFTLQVFVVAVMLVTHRPNGARWAALALICGLLAFIPWLPRTLAAADGGQPFWTPRPDLGDLPETFGVAFTGQAVSPAWLAAPVLAVLACVGLWCLVRRARRSGSPAEWGSGLSVAGGCGLIALWWVLSQWRPAYDVRYLGAAVPPLALAMAIGVRIVLRRRPEAGRERLLANGAMLGLVLLIGIGSGVALAGRISGVALAPGAAAVQALEARLQPGDVVLAVDARSYFQVAYLMGRTSHGARFRAPPLLWAAPGAPAFTGGDLVAPDDRVMPTEPLAVGKIQGLAPGGSIWLVAITDPQHELAAFTPLASGGVIEEERIVAAGNHASGLVLRLRPAG